MTSAEKLQAVIGEVKISKEEFGKRIGLGKSQVYDLFAGKQEPTSQTVAAVLSVFGVSPVWWETGHGMMLLSSYDKALELLRQAGFQENQLQIVGKLLSMDEVEIAKTMGYLDGLRNNKARP